MNTQTKMKTMFNEYLAAYSKYVGTPSKATEAALMKAFDASEAARREYQNSPEWVQS